MSKGSGDARMGLLAAAEKLEKELSQALKESRVLDAAGCALKLGRRVQASELFEKAGAYVQAARIEKEVGHTAHALGLVMRVSHTDPSYFEAVRIAVELATESSAVSHDFEQFIAPYTQHAPATKEDLDTWYLLAQLYELNDYLPHAIQAYRRVLAVDANHAGATERLRMAEARANQFATTEVLVSARDLRAVRELVGEKKKASVVSPPEPIGVGSLLAGRYQLERLLGTGSSGSVFKARDLKLSENVALKLLDTFATESTADARFKREVSLARRLSHANIVRIYDIAEHDQRPFLTMELLEGTDLRNYASKHRLELHQRLDLLRQTLEGLRHAHDSKVVHRDIKPENLFVTNHGELKIMDFGMAKAPGDASVTMAGSMGGTPYYMSPEQITDFRSADQRTDLYALGVVAYELFTGKLPFVSNVLTDLLLQHMEKKPATLRSHKPGLPELLDNIVLKLMAKKRDDRYQSAAEVLAALAQVKF